jgi:hypothetical protein
MALPRDYVCARCKSLIRAWEPKALTDTGWHHGSCVPGSAQVQRSRCCECDFFIAAGTPRVATVFGWAHPTCGKPA